MFRWKRLKKIDVDQRIGFRATDLAHDYQLLPSDAIHAATAILGNADVLEGVFKAPSPPAGEG